MRSLIRLMTSNGAWRSSPFCDLPEVPRNEKELTRHYFVLVGGLALILSRAAPAELSASLQATQMLYEALRRALPFAGPHAEAALLGEAMHEISEVADPRTKAAIRFCYDEENRRALKRTSAEEPQSTAPAYLPRQEGRGRRRPPAGDLETPTEISTDMFDRGSPTPGKSVKKPRGGGSGRTR